MIGVPLAWFPHLARATPEERERFEISPFGIHWEALDEDVWVEGLLAGRWDQRRVGGRGGVRWVDDPPYLLSRRDRDWNGDEIWGLPDKRKP